MWKYNTLMHHLFSEHSSGTNARAATGTNFYHSGGGKALSNSEHNTID
jgi:hypothetical protein